MLWTLLACADAVPGQLESRTWADGWSDHLVYRSVATDAVAAGGSDTAASADERIDAAGAAADGAWVLTLRATDDAGLGATLRELAFDAKDGLSVTRVDGVDLSPPVVLLPAVWEEGVTVTSGDYAATTEALAEATTWYGAFADVATVRITGPAGAGLAGVLRLAPGVGPVQLALGDVGGDLVWYDPSGAAE